MKKLTLILGLILLGGNWAFAQEQASPPAGVTEPEAASLYNEAYRSDNYDQALHYGRWIWRSMPRTFEFWPTFDLGQHMGRFVTIYQTFAEQAQDPAVISAYTDSVNMTFEKVFNNMEEEVDMFEWRFDYGRFLQSFPDVIENSFSRAAEQYRMLMEMDRERLIGQGEGYYVQVIIQDMISEDQEDAALQLMEEVQPRVSQEIANWFDQQREKLFDTPEERLAFLQEKLSEDPENVDLLTEIRSIHEDLDNNGEVAAINQKLYEIDPSFENTRALADAALSNANNKLALQYLTEALEKAPDNPTRASLALEIAQLHFNLDRLQQARQFARQAADLNPESGEPYMRIAAIYTRAVSNCTSGRDLNRDDRAVYWLVLDYYRQAKNVDPSLETRANNQIDRYSEHAPGISDVHFRSDWEQGETLRIDGSLNECYSWINETTTIPTFD